LLFGNGGSAATRAHQPSSQPDFVRRAAMPASPSRQTTSTLTSIANDYGYNMFSPSRWQPSAQQGDVAIAISTTANSERACGAARLPGQGNPHIGLTGGHGPSGTATRLQPQRGRHHQRRPDPGDAHRGRSRDLRARRGTLFGQGREQMKSDGSQGKKAAQRLHPPPATQRSADVVASFLLKASHNAAPRPGPCPHVPTRPAPQQSRHPCWHGRPAPAPHDADFSTVSRTYSPRRAAQCGASDRTEPPQRQGRHRRHGRTRHQGRPEPYPDRLDGTSYRDALQ